MLTQRERKRRNQGHIRYVIKLNSVFASPIIHSLTDTLTNSLLQGNTALHYGCRYSKLEVVKLMIEKGKADTSVLNRKGQNLLHIAAHSNSNVQVMKFLVEGRSASVTVNLYILVLIILSFSLYLPACMPCPHTYVI